MSIYLFIINVSISQYLPYSHAIRLIGIYREVRFVRLLKVKWKWICIFVRADARTDVPAFTQMVFGIGLVGNQRPISCIPISAILACKMGEIGVQNGWDCAVKWLILESGNIYIEVWRACNLHVGTHGSCVRSIKNESEWYVCLDGRTSRASLHASCLQIILIIGLILKVKVQCSKFKAKVPTYAWAINLFTCLRVNCQLNYLISRSW